MLPATPVQAAVDPQARQPGRPIATWLGAGILFAFWVWYVSTLRGVDGDYYWHLLAGRLMLAGHPVFSTDEFSWTAAGRPWFDHEWLGEVAMARLAVAGGVAWVKHAYAVLMIAWYMLLLVVFVRAQAGLLLASWGALATCLSAQTALWPRMQGFSLLGMACTLVLLQAWWRSAPAPTDPGCRAGVQAVRRLPRWSLVAYPILVALWANLHGGGSPAGPASCLIVLLVEAGLCTRAESGMGSAQKGLGSKLRGLGDLAFVTALSWAALLCNPRGWLLLKFSVSPLLDPKIRAMNALIPEWHCFAWTDPMCRHVTYWAATVLGAIALAWLLERVFRTAAGPEAGGGPHALGDIRPSMIALLGVWGILGLASRRHLPLFAIALAPLAGLGIGAAREGVNRLSAAMRNGFRGVAWFCAAVTIGPAVADRVLFGPLETGLRFPSEAALHEAVALAPGRHVLNLYDWGGELLDAGYPAVRDFVDGRQYPFGLAINAAHDQMMGAGPGWRRDLHHFHIDMLFVPPDVPLVAKLVRRPDWTVAFADRTATILIKREKARF